MLIPGADRALINRSKLQDYLLSSQHPIGRFKARFFSALGFGPHNWELLESALRDNTRLKKPKRVRLRPRVNRSLFGLSYEGRLVKRPSSASGLFEPERRFRGSSPRTPEV